MKIAVTTDHTGLAYGSLFPKLKEYLKSLGHEFTDFGPTTLDMTDDYPDFIFPAVKSVIDGQNEVAIIMGGTGQGEAMAANRIKGIKCTVFYGPAVAKTDVDAEGNVSEDPYEILKLSRQHNHANVLSLASRFLSLEEMTQALDVWLNTPYGSEERHNRRVKKIDEYR